MLLRIEGSILTIYFMYQLIFYIIGLTRFQGREERRKVEYKKMERMLIIIPAHNEENVIGNLLNDIRRSIYYFEKQCFDVIVLADHCTDKTLEICDKNQVRYIERNTGKPGKQYALNEFFEYYKDENDWDCFIILDADNRIEFSFLSEIMKKMESHNVVQAYLDAPDVNGFVKRAYEINYRVMNGTLQRARQALGLTAFLGGTGWGARWNIVQDVPFNLESITDDLEYTILLWLKGYRVEYLQDVHVFNEHPRTLRASYIQRLRWMRGGFQVLFKQFIPVLKVGLKQKKISCIDIIFALSVYLVGAVNCMVITATLLGLTTLNFSVTAYVFMQMLYLGFFVFCDPLSKKSLLFWLPASVVVNACNIILSIHSLVTFRSRKWVRTQHYGIN